MSWSRVTGWKRGLVWAVVLLGSGLVWGASYGGGEGYPDNPYQIWTPEHMDTLGATPSDWGYCFILMADIDLSAYPDAQYRIIGNAATRFTGTFDGNGYVIRRLNYASEDPVGYVGLFGYLYNATVRNLGVENSSVSCSESKTGGLLAGYLDGGSIENCYSTGSVYLFSADSNIRPCAGGLVGSTSRSFSVTSSCSTATVTCHSSVSSAYAGGLIGQMYGGVVRHCYGRGAVTASGSVAAYAGGLAGMQDTQAFASHCYSTGRIQAGGSGRIYKGGLMGAGGNAVNCFWDVQTSGTGTSAGGRGRTTEQMTQSANYIGWNTPAQTFWTIHEGVSYPKLAWEGQAGTPLEAQTFSDLVPGAGTADDPYRISTAEQLNAIGLYEAVWGGVFRLENDIILTIFSGTGAEFNRIGVCRSKQFTGTFDGNGHVIRHLTYSTPAFIWYAGLFGYADGATVLNLGIEQADVSTGGLLTGVLAGYLSNSSVISCSSSGIVAGGYAGGGLAGSLGYGTLVNCFSAADVVTSGVSDCFAGGLVGLCSGTIASCCSSGAVTCWTSGSTAKSYAGGLTGSLNAHIFNCYSTGLVTSSSAAISCAGGLAGFQDDSSGAENCYAGGSVQAYGLAVFRGGLIGYQKTGGSAELIACFWDRFSGGVDDGVSNVNPDPVGVTGLDTTDMLMSSTFLSAGWDFLNETANGTEDIWRMCTDGVSYPMLSRQAGAGDLACPDGVAVEDLGHLAGWWLLSGCAELNGCAGADLDDSGGVDLGDFAILAGYWMAGS